MMKQFHWGSKDLYDQSHWWINLIQLFKNATSWSVLFWWGYPRVTVFQGSQFVDDNHTVYSLISEHENWVLFNQKSKQILVKVTLNKPNQDHLTFSLFSSKPSHSKPMLCAVVYSDFSNNITQANNEIGTHWSSQKILTQAIFNIEAKLDRCVFEDEIYLHEEQINDFYSIWEFPQLNINLA